MKKTINIFCLSIILLVVGMISGFFAYEYGFFGNLPCSKLKFQFIDKDLSCNTSLVVKKHAYIELKGKLKNFIQQKKDNGDISVASIYFRDLNNGPTLGINEHENFAPASLLKVPMLITYLSLNEEDPGFLSRVIKFTKPKEENILTQDIVPGKSVEEGTPYTVNELLKYMIKYSDNNAYLALAQYLNQTPGYKEVFFDVMYRLGMVQPDNASEDDLTTKLYSSLFIQLYYASFFQKKETSETALALLSDTDFHQGLEAGLPAGTKIAHKFGERQTETGQNQLHDCGIIYYPQNPYFLCVMTRGEGSIGRLTSIIAAISKMVYEEFDSRKI
jgi:beta-lactamase class A